MSYNDFLQKLKFLGEPLTNQHVSHLRMIILLTENQSDCRRSDPYFLFGHENGAISLQGDHYSYFTSIVKGIFQRQIA